MCAAKGIPSSQEGVRMVISSTARVFAGALYGVPPRVVFPFFTPLASGGYKFKRHLPLLLLLLHRRHLHKSWDLLSFFLSREQTTHQFEEREEEKHGFFFLQRR